MVMVSGAMDILCGTGYDVRLLTQQVPQLVTPEPL